MPGTIAQGLMHYPATHTHQHSGRPRKCSFRQEQVLLGHLKGVIQSLAPGERPEARVHSEVSLRCASLIGRCTCSGTGSTHKAYMWVIWCMHVSKAASVGINTNNNVEIDHCFSD